VRAWASTRGSAVTIRVAPLVPIVKPQAAFFEELGPHGMTALGQVIATRYPNVAQLAAAAHEGVLGACDDDVEFAFGLDLVLDGLEHALSASG